MVTMNIGGLNGAEDGAGRRDGLASMKQSFAQIASAREMFGDVPNAARASAALEAAALSMLRELERAGVTVEDIRTSAATAAGIGLDTDEDARVMLSKVDIRDITEFDWSMEAEHPSVLEDLPPTTEYFPPGGVYWGAG
ncbi:hypothetical protein [Streptomyces avicenniae]|uniref:hypothetical protein n=1 Tax=Streptomyces avicenniae TaxID=500153 RepID=UPI00069928D7|nr:hypothetical protein [Streptomyces avicenniae]